MPLIFLYQLAVRHTKVTRPNKKINSSFLTKDKRRLTKLLESINQYRYFLVSLLARSRHRKRFFSSSTNQQNFRPFSPSFGVCFHSNRISLFSHFQQRRDEFTHILIFPLFLLRPTGKLRRKIPTCFMPSSRQCRPSFRFPLLVFAIFRFEAKMKRGKKINESAFFARLTAIKSMRLADA